ncbi:MAG: hypothetical protein HQK49_20965 [Oligoflexia bacterium]|nr:hypothetical protein [Oligoflexia bacterium]
MLVKLFKMILNTNSIVIGVTIAFLTVGHQLVFASDSIKDLNPLACNKEKKCILCTETGKVIAKIEDIKNICKRPGVDSSGNQNKKPNVASADMAIICVMLGHKKLGLLEHETVLENRTAWIEQLTTCGLSTIKKENEDILYFSPANKNRAIALENIEFTKMKDTYNDLGSWEKDITKHLSYFVKTGLLFDYMDEDIIGYVKSKVDNYMKIHTDKNLDQCSMNLEKLKSVVLNLITTHLKDNQTNTKLLRNLKKFTQNFKCPNPECSKLQQEISKEGISKIDYNNSNLVHLPSSLFNFGPFQRMQEMYYENLDSCNKLKQEVAFFKNISNHQINKVINDSFKEGKQFMEKLSEKETIDNSPIFDPCK